MCVCVCVSLEVIYIYSSHCFTENNLEREMCYLKYLIFVYTHSCCFYELDVHAHQRINTIIATSILSIRFSLVSGDVFKINKITHTNSLLCIV